MLSREIYATCGFVLIMLLPLLRKRTMRRDNQWQEVVRYSLCRTEYNWGQEVQYRLYDDGRHQEYRQSYLARGGPTRRLSLGLFCDLA